VRLQTTTNLFVDLLINLPFSAVKGAAASMSAIYAEMIDGEISPTTTRHINLPDTTLILCGVLNVINGKINSTAPTLIFETNMSLIMS
jgi:hypothetical protein